MVMVHVKEWFSFRTYNMLKRKKIELFQILQSFKICCWFSWMHDHCDFKDIQHFESSNIEHQIGTLSTFNLRTGFHQADKTDVEWVQLPSTWWPLGSTKILQQNPLFSFEPVCEHGLGCAYSCNSYLPLHQMWFNSGVELENSCVCVVGKNMKCCWFDKNYKSMTKNPTTKSALLVWACMWTWVTMCLLTQLLFANTLDVVQLRSQEWN